MNYSKIYYDKFSNIHTKIKTIYTDLIESDKYTRSVLITLLSDGGSNSSHSNFSEYLADDQVLTELEEELTSNNSTFNEKLELIMIQGLAAEKGRQLKNLKKVMEVVESTICESKLDGKILVNLTTLVNANNYKISSKLFEFVCNTYNNDSSSTELKRKCIYFILATRKMSKSLFIGDNSKLLINILNNKLLAEKDPELVENTMDLINLLEPEQKEKINIEDLFDLEYSNPKHIMKLLKIVDSIIKNEWVYQPLPSHFGVLSKIISGDPINTELKEPDSFGEVSYLIKVRKKALNLLIKFVRIHKNAEGRVIETNKNREKLSNEELEEISKYIIVNSHYNIDDLIKFEMNVGESFKKYMSPIDNPEGELLL